MKGLTKISARNFQTHLAEKTLPGLYWEKLFSDVTLVSEDEKYFSAHRNILTSVSPVLRRILLGLPRDQLPVIFLKDVMAEHLESLLHFIYNGEMDLEQENISKVAQLLNEFEVDKVFQIEDVQTEEETAENTKSEKETIEEVVRNSSADSPIEKFKIKEVNILEFQRIEEQKVSETVEKDARVTYFVKTESENNGNVEEEDKIVIGKRGRIDDSLKIETFQRDVNNIDYNKSDEHLNGFRYYKCNQCDHKTKYKTKGSLQRHIRVEHLNMRESFTCEQCGTLFETSAGLRSHIRRVHEDIHIRFKCDYENCDYTVSSKHHLTVHKEAFHEGITYKCDQCIHSTRNKTLLEKHMIAIHSDVVISCDLCEYKTKLKKNLRVHRQVKHEGVRHVCKYCGFEASHGSNLRSHIQTRHTEPNIACTLCPYKASINRQMVIHRRKVHGISKLEG